MVVPFLFIFVSPSPPFDFLALFGLVNPFCEVGLLFGYFSFKLLNLGFFRLAMLTRAIGRGTLVRFLFWVLHCRGLIFLFNSVFG